MDNETFELEEMEAGRLENGEPSTPTTEPAESPTPVPTGSDYEAENARYEYLQGVAGTGNGIKLEGLLHEWEEKGWLRDWRNDANLTLYADAITDGYLDIINVLLSFDVPLGDTLIRAIDVEFDEAIKAICLHLQTREDLRGSVLNGHSDNDDFHPAITPLILAAQRNNFSVVKLLLELGATIEEPSLSLGGDVTLTQAVSTLHVYRALSQPAYILATQTDVFGHAFELSKKLKVLSQLWEDFSAEFEEMASGLEVFAGELLGQSASTEEILALFRYHNTDKYRDLEGKQHPLAKLFEAIDYKQKEFIAHPHSQKAIITQFYKSLLDWNERGFLYQILLAAFVLLGYPIICLLYIFVPVRRVVNFARLPYVMMIMKAGSGFTFLGFVIAVTVFDKSSYPRVVDVLHVLILIWVIGLAWLHMKIIMKHGPEKYLSDSINLHEAIIVALYLTVFSLNFNGRLGISQNALVQRFLRDTNSRTYLNTEAFSNLQNHVVSALGGLEGQVKDTVVEDINHIVLNALSNCRPLNFLATVSSSLATASAPSLPPALQETIGYGEFEPTIVAETLFGVTITIIFLRLLNLLLVSDSIGPLRISLGGMVDDILKFLGIFMIIWFAFAIGLFQNFYSAGQSATRACVEAGEEVEDCQVLVGFSTFLASIQDLYWSLFGLTEIDILELPGRNSVAEGVGTFLYVSYLIVAVVVLLNALIGMLSNTYNLTEEHADTEWKFHRAAVWATYLRPVGTLPPPFNLVPSVKTLRRLCGCGVGLLAKRERHNTSSQKGMHTKRELEDYKRVLKLVSSRYIQGNLSVESQSSEGVRPRDLQALRNDILAFKFSVQDRLETVLKTLDISKLKSTNIHRQAEDLDPLVERTGEVLRESSLLTDNLGTLGNETDRLHEEQETEISQRDKDSSQLRETVAALRDEIKRLRHDHAEEAADRARKEASMSDALGQLREENTSLMKTVHGLQGDRTGLATTLRGLREDKVELTRIVGQLNAELQKFRPTPEPGATPTRKQEHMRGTERQLDPQFQSQASSRPHGERKLDRRPEQPAHEGEKPAHPSDRDDGQERKTEENPPPDPDPELETEEKPAEQMGFFRQIARAFENLLEKEKPEDPS